MLLLGLQVVGSHSRNAPSLMIEGYHIDSSPQTARYSVLPISGSLKFLKPICV